MEWTAAAMTRIMIRIITIQGQRVCFFRCFLVCVFMVPSGEAFAAASSSSPQKTYPPAGESHTGLFLILYYNSVEISQLHKFFNFCPALQQKKATPAPQKTYPPAGESHTGLFLILYYNSVEISQLHKFFNFCPALQQKKATPAMLAWLSATDTFDPQAPFFQLSLMRSHQVGS